MKYWIARFPARRATGARPRRVFQARVRAPDHEPHNRTRAGPRLVLPLEDRRGRRRRRRRGWLRLDARRRCLAMRRIETLRRLHRSLRRRVSRSRHAETNPRVRSRRARDRIRLARRFETAEDRPRSRLRADALAQRIHRPPPRPAAPLRRLFPFPHGKGSMPVLTTVSIYATVPPWQPRHTKKANQRSLDR